MKIKRFKYKNLFSLVILQATIVVASLAINSSRAVVALSLSSSEQIVVGATYYGGEYKNGWIIDNQNQCSRIANNEFTAQSLGGTVSPNCNDDNGLGYLNDIPLHNTVSFAELSNDAAHPDYSALGNLPAGARVEIEYNGRCLVAEKRDVGNGGYAVNGHPRAIDLWWQTARSIGFTNGFDLVKVKRVAGSTPLTPLGTSRACQVSASATKVAPPASPTANRPKAKLKTKPAAPESSQPAPAQTDANTEDQVQQSEAQREIAYAEPQVRSLATNEEIGDDSIIVKPLVFMAIIGLTVSGFVIYKKRPISKKPSSKRPKTVKPSKKRKK